MKLLFQIVFCLGLLLVAYPGRGQITNINFSLGQEKYNSRDWVGAATNFSATIEASYELWSSYSYRAYARSMLGDRVGALADCAEIIKLNRNYAGGHFWRAVIFLNLTNYDGALANYLVGMRLGPQYCPENLAAEISNGLSGRWERCFQGGDLSGAVSNLNVKIFLVPTNSGAYVMRGLIELFQNHYERSIADADLSLRYNQQQYLAYFGRAWAHWMMDDRIGAAEDCNLALAFISRSKQEASKRSKTNSVSADIWKSDVLMLEGLDYLIKGEKTAASDKFKSSFECETWKESNGQMYQKYWRQVIEAALAKIPEKK